MGEGAPLTTATYWDEVALTKLRNVLGPERAGVVMEQIMERIGLRTLSTADDLYRFGQAGAELGGFTAAVGALLRLHAVMHGASGTHQRG